MLVGLGRLVELGGREVGPDHFGIKDLVYFPNA